MNRKDSIGYMVANLIDEDYTVYFCANPPTDVKCVVLDTEGGVIAEGSEVGVYNALHTCYCQAPLLSRKSDVPDGQLSFAPDVAPVGVGDYNDGK